MSSISTGPPRLTDPYCGRYALTLRIMLANLRRKMGMVPSSDPAMMVPPFMDPALVAPPPPPPPFTLEELGAAAQWAGGPGGGGGGLGFSPSAIPLWLQEQVRALSPFVSCVVS